MEHPYILTISVCSLPMTRSPFPEINTCFSLEFHPPWLTSTNMETSIACLGAHTMNAQSLYFLLWLHPTLQKFFFSCPLEPGVCICVDQVVRSRIRVIGITWENVYKILAQCPEHGGDLLQFHPYPPSLIWAQQHVEGGFSLLPFSVLICFRSWHQHFFPAPWNWVLSSWPPEQSQHFILCYSHSSQPESSLEFSSRTRTKLPWQDLPLCLPRLTLHHHPSLIRGCCFTFQ